MREVTASGQTVENAVQSALRQLDLTEDQAEIEIIDEGKKGFLGIFGSALAIVKIKEKRNNIDEAEAFLQKVATNMGIDVSITKTVDEKHVTFEMNGDKIAVLIGKRGKTLNALQYLTQLVLNKSGNAYYSVTVDAEGYRKRREETLVELAHKMRDKALRLQNKVALEPMPAYERKIIHSALQQYDDVDTYSDGAEPHRHIVVQPMDA